MSMLPLTSSQNPLVKSTVDLHQAKSRREHGEILIEGRHPVEEALSAGVILTQLFLREGEQAPPNCPDTLSITYVNETVMGKLATTETGPPMLAVAKTPETFSPQLFETQRIQLLGLAGIQDPGNLGTLIRSACAFEMTSICLFGAHVDPYHPKVIRASAGLVFRLPFAPFASLPAFYEAHAEPLRSFQAWGADAHRGKPYTEAHCGEKSLLVLGSEAHGLPDEAWAHLQPLHIPVSPTVESLNVAVAGSILLSHFYQTGNRPSDAGNP